MSKDLQSSILSSRLSSLKQANALNGENLEFIEGVVTNYSYTSGTYSVSSGYGSDLNCIYIGAVMSGLIGLKANVILEAGTKVLIMHNSKTSLSYILGTIPNAKIDADLASSNYVSAAEGNGVLKSGLLDKDWSTNSGTETVLDGSQPIDITPGELQMSTGSGTALTLLQSLASLQGSDLAKVECFVLDDMVRILSNTFQNINAFGEYSIFNENGNLNVVWNGTSNEYESFGAESSTEPKFGGSPLTGENKVKTDKDAKDLFYEDGKWRFSQYIGKLGNFIHTFITDPSSTLNNAKDNDGAFSGKPKAGRFNMHVNEDGSMLCQSVGDIVLEKVACIPVPVETKKWEENKDDEIENKDALKNWIPLGNENLWESSYKLNDYAKWFSGYYCNAGFWQSKRFIKPEEKDTPDLDPWAKDSVRKEVDGAYGDKANKYIESYATVRIFKDGSIVIKDAYGSSINMSGGNVTIAAANNLNLTAANAVNINGKFINTQGTAGISNTAAHGGIENVSRYFNKTFVSEGPIALESDVEVTDTKNALIDSYYPKENCEEQANYMESLVENDDKYISGIIMKTNKDTASIAIKSKGAPINFIASDSAIISKAKEYIISTLSYNIENLLNYQAGKLKIYAQTTFFSIVKCAAYFISRVKLAIASCKENVNGAVKADDSIEMEKYDNNYKYIDPQYVGVNTALGFKYKTPIVDDDKDLYQSLTDQSLSNVNEDPAKTEVLNMTELNPGNDKNIGSPYPGKTAKMKSYIPTVKNLNKKYMESIKAIKQSEIKSIPYAVTVTKNEE